MSGGSPDRGPLWLPWTLVLFAAAYAAVLWSNPLNAQVSFPDSHSYVEFYPFRTAGYPVFLDLVAYVFGSVQATPRAQLLVACAAFAYLAWSIHGAFRSRVLTLLVALSLFGNPEIAKFHVAVLTESVFISLLCVMAGNLALLVVRPTLCRAAVSALACGIAITVRPAGLGLMPIWPILIWFIGGRCSGRRLRLSIAMAVPLVACTLAESVAWHLHHPDLPSRPTLVNRHLYGRGLMMDSVSVGSEDEIGVFLNGAREKTEAARAFVAGAPDGQTRLLLLTRYEVLAQHELFHEEVEALSGRRGATRNEVLGEIGWRAIAASPQAWVANAVTNYAGLWTMYELLTPAASRRYARYVEQATDVPFSETGVIRSHRPSHPAAWPVRVVMMAAFMATAFAASLAVYRRWRHAGVGLDERLLLAAICGLLVHGHYALVALVGVANARYSLAMWPLLALCGLFLGASCLAHPRRRSGAQSSVA